MTKKSIVIHWPEKVCYLVEHGKKCAITDRTADGTIPPAWIDGTVDVRVVVEENVFYRIIDLHSPGGGQMVDAALFMLEPTLPIPMEDLAAACVVLKKQRKKRTVLVALLPRAVLERVKSEVRDALGERALGVPLSWIGAAPLALATPAAGAWRGRRWAGLVEAGRWNVLQSARTGEAAAAAIQRRLPDSAPAWRELTQEDEVKGAVSAKADAAWSTDRVKRGAGWMAYWPAAMIVLSVLLVAAAFGLRYNAAAGRARSASSNAEAAFKETFPEMRVVSPAEQLKAQRRNFEARAVELNRRFSKSQSALEVLAALETVSDPGDIKIDDLRITRREFTVIGSATSVAVVQNVAAGLKNEMDLPSEPASRYRQSAAGLGWDFTIEGAQ